VLDEISLEAAVRQLTGVARSGTFSRCVGYHHLAATQPSQPLWGIGSKRFGGRFTPRNSFETIYLAEDPVTALAEVSAVLLNPGGGVITLPSLPWVTVTVQGTLLAVLDVSDMGIQAKLGTTSQELTGVALHTGGRR
jgi:RES domain-containing protein